MSSLRRRMAEHGFESNEDYDYQVRCLLNHGTEGLRCLNIEGVSPRRKTAFASALARSLEYPHVLYYDFTQQTDPMAKVELVDRPDEEGEKQVPVGPFDRAVSEACAYSEAEPTILIVDQLQAADFREHIRLYHLVTTTEWEYSLATLHANPKNLLLFLISEEALFHSLQKASFRVWTDPGNTQLHFQPSDFDLDDEVAPVFEALGDLFSALDVGPTRSEFRRILDDVLGRARTVDYLRHSIYGWTESVDHGALHARELEPHLEATLAAVEQYLGLDEIEVGS